MVYDELRSDGVSVGMYSALADPAERDRALSMDGWILNKTSGSPGFMQSWDEDREVVTDLPRGSTDQGVEPLVLLRESAGRTRRIIGMSAPLW